MAGYGGQPGLRTPDANKTQLPDHRSPQSGVAAAETTSQEGLTETRIYAQGVDWKINRNYQTGTHIRSVTSSYALSTQSIYSLGKAGCREHEPLLWECSRVKKTPLAACKHPLSGTALCSAGVALVMSLALRLFIQPSVKATNIY